MFSVLRPSAARLLSAAPAAAACARPLSTASPAAAASASSISHLTALLHEGTYASRDYAARLAACGKPPDEVDRSLRAIYASADRQGTGALALSGVVDAIRAIKERCPLARAALFYSTSTRTR